MPTTPTLALPYPASSATPDVPYDLQQLAQAVEGAMTGKPRCKISQATPQAVANTTLTLVTWDTTDYDNNAMADLVNERIVIKTAGWYTVTAFIPWANNSTGYRLTIVDAGTTPPHIMQDYRAPATGTSTGIHITSEPVLLAVNDFAQIKIQQSSGGSLSLGAINSQNPFLAVHWHAAA